MANFLGEFDAWLPNSEEEYEIIQREFRLKKEKYIALNAVSNNFFVLIIMRIEMAYYVLEDLNQ